MFASMSSLLFASFALAATLPQGQLVTQAEATNYRATSSYADVVRFVRRAELADPRVRVEWIGKSTEGRPIPLVIVGPKPGMTPSDARRQKLLVIYVQANIHAGEVEGKEASLMFLRRLIQRDPRVKAFGDRAVFLINPIYNADGNEKWGPVAVNRPEQDGPDLVGLRPNGQGLDLNRDCIKVESPEMKAALASIYNRWDPHATLDLHTTDGTRHGWGHTYAPSVQPSGDLAVTAFTRDELLPFVRAQFLKRDEMHIFDYGNMSTGKDNKPIWSTFESGPRFVTNYVGLRGRIAVLSEAPTYLPFQERVLTTLRFVDDVCEYLVLNGAKVRRLTAQADEIAQKGQIKKTGIAYDFDSVKSEKVPIEKRPWKKEGRPTEIEWIEMPIFDRFKATSEVSVPTAYAIPADQTAAINLLKLHGIDSRVLKRTERMMVEPYHVRRVKKAARPFQGHELVTLEGSFGAVSSVDLGPGTVIVPTNQKLSMLAVQLLEAGTQDGFVTWNVVNATPDVAYPILRVVTGKG